MPTTLELCEKYFGTKDIYKLMNLTKDSLEKDGKVFLAFFLLETQTWNKMMFWWNEIALKNEWFLLIF